MKFLRALGRQVSTQEGADLLRARTEHIGQRPRVVPVARQACFKPVEIRSQNRVDRIKVNGFLSDAKCFLEGPCQIQLELQWCRQSFAQQRRS